MREGVAMPITFTQVRELIEAVPDATKMDNAALNQVKTFLHLIYEWGLTGKDIPNYFEENNQITDEEKTALIELLTDEKRQTLSFLFHQLMSISRSAAGADDLLSGIASSTQNIMSRFFDTFLAQNQSVEPNQVRDVTGEERIKLTAAILEFSSELLVEQKKEQRAGKKDIEQSQIDQYQIKAMAIRKLDPELDENNLINKIEFFLRNKIESNFSADRGFFRAVAHIQNIGRKSDDPFFKDINFKIDHLSGELKYQLKAQRFGKDKENHATCEYRIKPSSKRDADLIIQKICAELKKTNPDLKIETRTSRLPGSKSHYIRVTNPTPELVSQEENRNIDRP